MSTYAFEDANAQVVIYIEADKIEAVTAGEVGVTFHMVSGAEWTVSDLESTGALLEEIGYVDLERILVARISG